MRPLPQMRDNLHAPTLKIFTLKVATLITTKKNRLNVGSGHERGTTLVQLRLR